MQINIDIENTIASALEEALAPAKLRAVITTKVNEVTERAVAEVFGSSYGEFGKAVKSAVQSLVPHELSLDGQAQFTNYVAEAIRERVAAFNHERMTQVMNPLLDGLLALPPAEIKLSELVARAVEAWSDNYGTRRYGRPTVIVELGEESVGSSLGQFWHVYMDAEQDKSKYSCSHHLHVTGLGEVYSLVVNGNDIKGNKFAGPFYNFDAYLFSLYTAKTKLVRDITDFWDVYYPGSDD